MTRLTIAVLASCFLFGSSLGVVGCTTTGDVVIKKKKKKKKRTKRTVTRVQVDKVRTVKFKVKNVGLREVVLPLFEKQAGVKIKWNGEERQLSLRLTNPMPWRDALNLVCQFTNTHLAEDYRGRLILKDHYGGTLGNSAQADELAGKKTSGGKIARPGSRRRRASGSSSGGGQVYVPDKSPSVGYNKGNKPGAEMWGKVGDGR